MSARLPQYISALASFFRWPVSTTMQREEGDGQRSLENFYPGTNYLSSPPPTIVIPRGWIVPTTYLDLANNRIQQQHENLQRFESLLIDLHKKNENSRKLAKHLEQESCDLIQKCKGMEDAHEELMRNHSKVKREHQNGIEGLEQALMKAQTKYEDTLRMSKDEERKISKLTSQNKSLIQKLGEMQSRLDQAREERDSQKQLISGYSMANPGKVADSDLKSKWKQLDYDIRSLAFTLAKFAPNGKPDTTAAGRMKFITEDFAACILDEACRRFFIQGYLWTLVVAAVFDGNAGIWAGDAGSGLKSVMRHTFQKMKEPESQQFPPQVAIWLSQGVALLHQLWGLDHKTVKGVTYEESKRIWHFIGNRESVSAESHRDVWKALYEIVDNALGLDQIFMESKAMFRIEWDFSSETAGEKRYYPEGMEAVGYQTELSPQSLVRFFAAPALIKIGNADGQHYDAQTVLCKASVVCN
ncbi:hypothetical protein G7046_g4999 [Stylonectria norvegica]|nr:hypothetical protein G7046_g4999 [Stylonectria norvegica]